MLACVAMETDQLQNKYQGTVLSHVYCRKTYTQTFTMAPLQDASTNIAGNAKNSVMVSN